ncbi:thermonuclease family protein [Campylobacter sp. VicNov18]|uniref:thermonuclease family protein n=1 Tax=Campylobacter bilis TaxID=2691918 RepID=UPI00130E04C7|nr:thermonuclease family protein [Campylobacter bilis]MPV63857.1 nuclease [Campylobacter hepaticus]MBM0637358.1 nuclease [Campylobacter bilis]MCC8278077.1 thermonuclease family protein [Campylobacter bilis]MCC8299581.1 thermonuclease family protein [Campylobacter bilis]MCC8300986.1 thermonuclease family protein [Campylobacter bilis]
MRLNNKKLFNLRRLLSDPKKFFSLLIFVLVIAFVQNFIAQNSSFEGKVIRVIDGDTIELSYGDKITRVRFFGIDAPELKQSFGPQSKEALSKILKGKQVQVIYKNKDVYGRIVAIVKLNDLDVNRFLVSKGYAWADIYYNEVYIKEQEYARKNRLGLWKESNPIEPYKWRKQNKF